LAIQTVTMSDFHTAIFPTYAVQAALTRVSFEDLLRQFRGRPDSNDDLTMV